VSHAYRILHWQENLVGDEMPPEWMWPLSDELEDWFADVEVKRKAKYGGGGADEFEDPPEGVMTNTLAAAKRRG